MQFKVLFPAPYQVTDIYDDNLDVNIVLEGGDVYFGTLFTLKNINKLIGINSDVYFWSTDMLILKELSHQGIYAAVEAVLNDGYLDEIFSKIGTIETVYSHQGWKEFADISKVIRLSAGIYKLPD